jgi:hypothetical protein
MLSGTLKIKDVIFFIAMPTITLWAVRDILQMITYIIHLQRS